MAGLRDLGCSWQGNGEHEHRRRVVLVDLLSHNDDLCSLCTSVLGDTKAQSGLSNLRRRLKDQYGTLICDENYEG
jgi:hypothetical protein